jgi:sodium transport system permease protein
VCTVFARFGTLNWSNVRLITVREIRDQLRDRRTLFVIAVLPIVLYPLLAMSVLQISQFRHDQPSRVAVLGAKELDGAEVPPLFETAGNRSQFAGALFGVPGEGSQVLPGRRVENRMFELALDPAEEQASPSDRRVRAEALVHDGLYDAVLYFPPGFAKSVAELRAAMAEHRRQTIAGAKPSEAAADGLAGPEIVFTEANDKSQLAFDRLDAVLECWINHVGAKNLADNGLPTTAIRPFDVRASNLSGASHGRATTVWSKVLPVLLLLWALTGAFYPAIDLCAGEKERGTLETLLCSPAERSEIVLGKLLTIMLFSAVTALLNLISGGITSWLMLNQMMGTAFPSPLTVVWLLLALVPVSALFSALALALAAFARSSKEGQYYLMPLLLITTPLAVLPAAPGVELTLGNSLIPVTGIVLLLRNLLEGNYWQAVQFAPPVIGITLVCCLLSIRWAVDQFNSESVLFRESERLDMGLWLHHLLRDREATPTVAAAVFCGVVILLIRFFLGTSLPSPSGFRNMAIQALVVQLTVILTPALLMTVMLTNSPRQTLLLRWPRWYTLPVAAVLAVAMHPVVTSLHKVVDYLYPVPAEVAEALAKLLEGSPNLWELLVVMAVAPAICEELAFRGFILSGFRHMGHRGRAIVWSAVFFGLTHAILQQSLIASLVGLVIGLLAVQTGSILPGMVYHVVHNTLAFLPSQISEKTLEAHPSLTWLFPETGKQDVLHYWPVVVAGLVVSGLVIAWVYRLPWRRSAEETLQEAIDHASHGSALPSIGQ